MSDLVLLPKSGHPYVYARQPNLLGCLSGTLIYRHIWERVQVAEDYIRVRSPAARLVVLDSVRSVALQAELFLQASATCSPEFPGIRASSARSMARNPVVDVEAEHVVGVAVDLVLADGRTGLPYPDDLARYDSWGPYMRPDAFVKLAHAHLDTEFGRRYAATALREVMVREACKFAGFTASADEFCQFHAPDTHHGPLAAVDLREFLARPIDARMETGLLDRCLEIHSAVNRAQAFRN